MVDWKAGTIRLGGTMADGWLKGSWVEADGRLSNGDLAAMVLLDAIARRLPGAIKEESATFESFSAELEGGLEYPHYTRPPEFRGWGVPEVLLSGDHGKIEEWRREQSRQRTAS